MFIEFRVANFRSLKEEQSLTFEADAQLDSTDPRLRIVPGHHRPLLPVAIICGSNASGKSNLLAAIQFMRESVLNSHQEWRVGEPIPRTAFKWAGSSALPSLFEITFLLNSRMFQYGFCLDDERVLEEWLYERMAMDTVSVFERVRQTIEIHPGFQTESDLYWPQTSATSLFLSCFQDAEGGLLQELNSWFREISVVYQVVDKSLSLWNDQESILGRIGRDGTRIGKPNESTGNLPQGSDNVVSSQSSSWRRSLDFLRSLDLGIVDVKWVQESSQDGHTERRMMVKHAEDPDAWLELQEESKGTQCLLQLAPIIVRALEIGGLLLIDELESSLHPLIGLSLVRLFNEPATNPLNAQLLFTTHDTRLLGNTLGDCILRKDQIWFAEKDRNGASIIFPLTDFHSTDGENYERGYLQGRYGAIPHCETFLWNEK